MESNEDLEGKLEANAFYRLMSSPEFMKNSNRYAVPLFYKKFEEFVDDFVRMSYEITGKKYMTLGEISKGLYKGLKIRIKPSRLHGWIFKYQEETGFDIIREKPGSNPKLYALSSLQKSLTKTPNYTYNK